MASSDRAIACNATGEFVEFDLLYETAKELGGWGVAGVFAFWFLRSRSTENERLKEKIDKLVEQKGDNLEKRLAAAIDEARQARARAEKLEAQIRAQEATILEQHRQIVTLQGKVEILERLRDEAELKAQRAIERAQSLEVKVQELQS